MKRRFLNSFTSLIVAFCFILLFSGHADAEMFISGYLGLSSTHDSDVELNQTGGTDLTFSEVSWDDDSFSSPLYYGLRLGYWFKKHPNWGIAVDYTHAKMYGNLERTAIVTGTRDGAIVQGQERVGDTFDVLEFSDGHNLLTLNGMYRAMSIGYNLSRLQPYILAGMGVAIPHVEVTADGDETYEYQVAGFAAQGGAGLDVDITKWFSAFAEYRLSYAAIEADLAGGGTLKTEPWTHHFTLGLTFSFLH